MFDRSLEDEILGWCRLSQLDERDIDLDRWANAQPVDRVTGPVDIPCPRQPESRAVGQLDELLETRAARGSQTHRVGPAGTRDRCHKQLGGVSSTGIRQQDQRRVDGGDASGRFDQDLLIAVFGSTEERARADKETGGCDARFKRATGVVPPPRTIGWDGARVPMPRSSAVAICSRTSRRAKWIARGSNSFPGTDSPDRA